MKSLNKVVFLAFLMFFSSKAFCEKQWGGVSFYAYKDGQAYLLVAFDSSSNNKVWGDFSCELRDDEPYDLLTKLFLCAHLGTRGAFASVNDQLVSSKSLQDQKAAFKAEVNFFKDRLEKSETRVINHDGIDYFLYFVQVPFIPAHNFIDSFYVFRKNYSQEHEYLRRTGFAWLKIIDLINIINQRKTLKMDLTKSIVFEMHKTGKNFIAKTSELKVKFPDNKVVLNTYFSAELSAEGVLNILNEIVGKIPKVGGGQQSSKSSFYLNSVS